MLRGSGMRGGNDEGEAIAILKHLVLIGEYARTVAGEVGDAGTGGVLQLRHGGTKPTLIHIHVHQGHLSNRIRIGVVGAERNELVEHAVRRPFHGGHRGDTQPLIEVCPGRIIDSRHHVGDTEVFSHHAGGDNIRIIAGRNGSESVRLLDAGLLEHVTVKSHTGHLLSGEILRKTPKCLRVPVNDRYRMTHAGEGTRQRRPHSATTHNHEVHALHATARGPDVADHPPSASRAGRVPLYAMTRTAKEAAGATGIYVLVTMSAILVPGPLQSTLAHAPAGTVGGATAVGIAVLAIALAGSLGVTRLVPRASSQTLAATYLGARAGVIMAAARFVCHVLLLVMIAGVVATVMDRITPFAVDGRLITIPLVILLAIPTMLGKRVPPRLLGAGGFAAGLALTTVIVAGLIHEASATDAAFAAIAQAPAAPAPLSTMRPGAILFASVHPTPTGSVGYTGADVVRGCLVALLPAALLVVVSERLTPRRERRHVPFRVLLRSFGLAAVAIMLSTYMVEALGFGGAEGDVTLVGVAGALMNGQVAAAVGSALILGAMSAVLVVYDRIPRLLSELARDRILPAAFASPEARRPRRAVVVVAGLLAALIAAFVTANREMAQMFVFSAFTVYTLYALALVRRGLAVLRKSEEQEVRRHAATSRWVFGVLAVFGLLVLLTDVVVNPFSSLLTMLVLAIPSALVLAGQRRRAMAVETLRPDDLTAGRSLPTRVHGIILVDALDLPSLRAVTYARSLRLSTLTALLVDFDPRRTGRVREDWDASRLPVSLTVLGTPAGSLREPVLTYVRALLAGHPHDVVAVFAPSVSRPDAGRAGMLRGGMRRLFAELSQEDRVMLIAVPYSVSEAEESEE